MAVEGVAFQSGDSLVTVSANNPLPVTGGSLPAGASTSANQATEITSLGTIATAQGAQGTGLNPPSGGSGVLGFLSGIYNKLLVALALGQTTRSASIPVTQASDPDIRVTSASTTVADTASTSTAGFNASPVLTGTPTVNSTLLQAINGQSSVTVTLSACTATANCEVSGDGGVTFAAITMRQRGSGYTTSAPTGIGVFDGECSGKTHFRVRQTGAGGLTAAMTFSSLTNAVEVMNPLRLFDNTSGAQSSIKAASTAAVATDTALVVGISPNSNALVGLGSRVNVVPTVTAGAYTSGYVVGGIMTFANALPASFNGLLESLSLKFKGSVQSAQFDVAIFSASPAGTFADNGAPVIAGADTALLLGIYPLTTPYSDLGTHTIYNLDGIGKQIVGASTSLYAVVIAKAATAALASTSDMSLSLGVMW